MVDPGRWAVPGGRFGRIGGAREVPVAAAHPHHSGGTRSPLLASCLARPAWRLFLPAKARGVYGVHTPLSLVAQHRPGRVSWGPPTTTTTTTMTTMMGGIGPPDHSFDTLRLLDSCPDWCSTNSFYPIHDTGQSTQDLSWRSINYKLLRPLRTTDGWAANGAQLEAGTSAATGITTAICVYQYCYESILGSESSATSIYGPSSAAEA